MNISNINNFNIYKIQNKPIQQGFRQSNFVKKPDTFERNTNITFTGKSNRIKQYTKTTEALVEAGNSAHLSLNGQLASEGWAGKVADSVSALWGSKNRASLVKEDITTYHKQVDELKSSIKENKFTDKFKEIFGVEYNQSNIQKFNKASKKFNLAVTTSAMSDIISSKLNDDIKHYKENNGEYKDVVKKRINPYAQTGAVPYYYETIKKENILNNIEKDLVDIVGSKDALNGTLKASGFDTEKMSDKEKYNAYGLMAVFLSETTKETAKNICGGKNIKELKNDYDKAYEKAYGTKNDIQKRVDKYNRSQVIGAAAVRGATRSALGALVMLAAPEAGFAKLATKAVTTMGVKVLVDGSDKMSNSTNNSMDSKAFKKLIHSASISGAEKIAIGALGAFMPEVSTGIELLDEVVEQTRDVAIETSIGMVAEKLKKGNWATNQIAPRILISFVFNNLNVDNDELKTLIGMSKDSINQAMKFDKRGVNPVKTVVEGTKQALEKAEFKNDKSFDELRNLSINNPEEYTKMMISALDEVLKEHKDDDMD